MLLALAAGLSGCRQFQEHRSSVESLYAAGRYDEIARTLDEPQTRKLYGERSAVLWKLDRGATALALDDDATAIRLLSEAEDEIEMRREKSAGDAVASWLLSDASTAYVAEPYEDLYLNVLKLLAQLEAGRIEGGATVEARRLASKADLLRDRFVKYEEAVRSTDPQALRAGLEAVGTGGQFVESPLGTYLTALTFMKSGEPGLQAVAGRRLEDSIRLQGALLGPVRAEDFRGLGELRAGEANVLVVALSGRGPTKRAERFGPIPLGTVPIYLELPVLQTFPSRVTGARVEVDGLPDAGRELAFVEDFSRVARVSHERMLPLIYARTYARVAAKAVASVALTEAGRRGARDSNQGLVQLGGVLAGLALMYATEEADVRAWMMLPGQAHATASLLPPGRHRVRVVYLAGGSPVHTTPWSEVDVTPAGLATIVTHYWE